MRLNFTFRKLFILLVVLLAAIDGFSQCSITASRNTTGLSCGTSPLNACGGVLYIGDGTNPMTLTMTSNVDLSCLGPIRFIVKNGATIDFSAGNYDLILAAGSSIEIESGGQVGAPTNCSASDLIKIGDVKVASCMGGSALTNFPDLVSSGGYSSVIATASPSSFCDSGSSTLTATASPSSGATYRWYDAQTGGNLLNTGSTYNIGPITSTKTYYVDASYTSPTTYTTVRKAVTVTVTNIVAPTGTASQSFCSGATVANLLATGTDVKWYAASSGGTALASTTVLTNGTHYYASQTVSGCESLSRLDVTAIINSASVAPTSITGTTTICNGESTALTVNGGNLGTGAAIEWFTGSCNGTSVGTGNSITVSPITNTTYYVRYNGLCNITTCVSTMVTVNSLPNNITNGFSATTICAGGSPQLTFDAEDATFSTPYSITYKNDATSAQYTVSIPSASAYSFTPGDNPTSNTGYTLVSISNATCTRTSGFANPGANLIVRPAPTATVSGTTSVCVGALSPNIIFTNPQTVAITITYNINGGTNQTVNVAASSSSSLAASTASAGNFVYNLVSVVYQSTPNCSNTLSGSATVTVNNNSVAPTSITGTTSICSGDSTTLTLSGGTAGTGAVAKWYSGSCGGTLLGTGNSISVSPTSTTTYFVRYEGTCNTTSCASATVTVNDNNTVSAASSSPMLCVNATMTNVTHTTTGATGLGVANNLPAGVTASWASNTITITGVPTESGTFNYNIPLTGGCGDVSATGMIVVNPLPTTPTAGTPTNPTCTRPTGSVPLNGLPASGTIIQTGEKNETYTIAVGGTQIITGLLPGTYYFAVDNGSCTSATTDKVEIVAPVTNTWSTGSWSDGTPTINQRLVFASDYTNANDVDIEGCSCQVTGSITVTIKSGRTLKIENGVEVQPNAKLIFENNASLVQINEDPTINSGDIIYHRHTGFVKRYDFTYWSSPVAGQTLKALSPNTLYDKYYSYNPTSGWKIEYNGTAIMEKGRGYIIRAPQTFSITVPAVDTAPEFVGVPNNGLVSYEVPSSLVNLIGNPYPSAIDADKFIAANSTSLEGTLYFWTHNTSPSKDIAGDAIYNYTTNDYVTYNKTGGVNLATGKIAAGQSFFAPSTATGGTVVFNNAMRYTEGQTNYDNSQFYKFSSTSKTTAKAVAEIEKSRIWLNLTNKEGAYKQMLIGYIAGATNDYDRGFDGVSYDGNQYVDFYSVNQGTKLSIQGRAVPFVKQDSVALGYKSTIVGEFQISIDHTDGVLSSQNVFLEDKDLNILHDLKKGAYTFSTVKGTFKNRFVLRYVDKNAVEPEPVIETPQVDEVDKTIMVSVNNNEITVSSSEDLISKIIIYDVSGKIIYQKENVSANDFVIQNLLSSQQLLLVSLVLENGKTIATKVLY